MSQDIVRQYQRGPANIEDAWGSAPMQANGLASYAPGANGALGFPGQPPGGGGNDAKPLQTIHRSLRGRYKLAILLAAVGAAVGSAAGYRLNNRIYRGTGQIRISPVTSNPNGVEVTPEYSRFMNSEANSIRSADIASRVVNNPEWKAVAGNRGSDAGAQAALIANTKSTYAGMSNDITVTYDDANPKVVVAAINSILAAYSDIRKSTREDIVTANVAFFEKAGEALQSDIDELNKQISKLQRGSQGNLDDRSNGLTKQLNDLERQRADADITLQRMNIIKQRFLAHPQPIDSNILAMKEPTFGQLVAVRNNLIVELTQLQQLRGPNNPTVVSARAQLDSVNQKVKEIAAAMSEGFYGMMPPLGGGNGGQPIEVSNAKIEDQTSDIAVLDKQIDSVRQQVNGVVDQRVSLQELIQQVKVKNDRLADNTNRLALAQAKAYALNAPFKVIASPAVDTAEDKRIPMAAFGFIAGAGLPLAGLVLLGLMDRKYRYSDETNASSITRGIPLLGILPNLPDRLSDPSQASVAAHCVHQIRTMLQLNAVNAEGPTVLSVTSATSGDGKTSLSLALGLSFAASGSRTLLIDTDLIGAGLSNRLGIREPSGISEAITARNAMEFVRDTDVQDLSILPVGMRGPQNASAFSPNAVRRLLNEMRKHFDLILIDTGPVLGSIEATPVVASSDGVILTASRGQNRDLVEKAILQLRNAGARIAGFVFNRANAKDFERSISGISLRSVSRAQAAPGQSTNGQYQDSRLGPLVHSVRGTTDDGQS